MMKDSGTRPDECHQQVLEHHNHIQRPIHNNILLLHHDCYCPGNEATKNMSLQKSYHFYIFLFSYPRIHILCFLLSHLLLIMTIKTVYQKYFFLLEFHIYKLSLLISSTVLIALFSSLEKALFINSLFSHALIELFSQSISSFSL